MNNALFPQGEAIPGCADNNIKKDSIGGLLHAAEWIVFLQSTLFRRSVRNDGVDWVATT
jgi:hypothetical protein